MKPAPAAVHSHLVLARAARWSIVQWVFFSQWSAESTRLFMLDKKKNLSLVLGRAWLDYCFSFFYTFRSSIRLEKERLDRRVLMKFRR